MEGTFELSFEGDTSEGSDDEYLNEQINYFPPANDVFDSGNIFLPHEPFRVEITHVYWISRFNYLRDRVRSPSISNPFIDDENILGSPSDGMTTTSAHGIPSRYEITLHHGPFEWKVFRRYNDIVALHREIVVDQMKRRVKRVTNTVKKGFHQNQTTATTLRKTRLSVFPKRPNFAVTEEYMTERTRMIQDYLQSIVEIRQLRYLEGVMRFFEISPITFRMRLGIQKYKEGTILKMPKSRRLAYSLFPCCVCKFTWQSRWLVLKDSYLVMLKPGKLTETAALPATSFSFGRQGDGGLGDAGGLGSQATLQTLLGDGGGVDQGPKGNGAEGECVVTQHSPRHYHRNRQWRYCKVLLMDQFFNYSTRGPGVAPILHVGNMHFHMKFRGANGDNVGDWMDKLTKVISQPAALGYVQANPHKSFAPVRTDGKMLLCIDGASYMDAVADGINQAQNEIFITDWWLSPEVFMKRPAGADNWRLDLMLKRKAESGVRVCIMVYREVAMALKINSRHTSRWLSSLHPNIHVLRHPDHIHDAVLFWSHHEKLVVIDQSIAFMGGIDLCYGRWDRQDHPLLDLDKSMPYKREVKKPQMQIEDATKSFFVALMPFVKDLPELGRNNLTAATSTPDLRHRSDSLSVLTTDMPAEEVERDRRARRGDRLDNPPAASPPGAPQPSMAAVAAVARAAVTWKRQASQAGDLETNVKVMPDGQVAFRSSVRGRHSGRRRNKLQREHSSQINQYGDGDSGRDGDDRGSHYEPTVDIQIPVIGRLQVPVDQVNRGPSNTYSSHQRHASERRPTVANSNVHRKMTFTHRRTVSQSIDGTGRTLSPSGVARGFGAADGITSPRVVISSVPKEGRPSSPSQRKPKISRADIGTRLQGLFVRVGSQLRRPSVQRSSSSDDSDELEYDNLGFQGRRMSKVPFGRLRRGFSTTVPPPLEDREDSVEQANTEEESLLAQLSRKFLFVGKDYGNWLAKDAFDLEKPDGDNVDRTSVPRMPWHDVGCAVSGSIASDFARHFIQRWNATRIRKVKRRRKRAHANLPIPPMLLPSPPCEPWIRTHLSTVCGKRRAHPIQMQALRSAGKWALVANGGGGTGVGLASGDLATTPNNLDVTPEYTERSILNAYVEAIRKSEHYVYIENQFYISWLDENTMGQQTATGGGGDSFDSENELLPCVVQNTITQALYDRIVRAHKENKPYRVYIILPLLPGFEGDAGSRQTGISIHCVLHYIRESLFRGPTALIPRLNLIMSRPWDHISVCGLRTYDTWPDDILTSEFIYVHCKLMIVDDRKLIIGSANINDRSMLGYRDSELAVVAEDTAEVGTLREATFAGQKVMIGEVARRFRKTLMAEHLGALTKESRESLEWDYGLLDDPVCDEFFHNVWSKIADRNMDLFDKVFSCLPSNDLYTFADVKVMRQSDPLYISKPEEAKKLVKEIRGHLVRYPEDFLRDEDISPPQGSKEIVVPVIVWT